MYMKHSQRKTPRASKGAAPNIGVESLVACVCPCVSVAQLASSIGLSYPLTLAGFGGLHQLGLVLMLVVTESEFYGALAALKVATFCFGPVLTILITVLVYECYRGAIDGTIFGIVLRSVVVDLVFACGAQIIRDKFLKHIGVPANDAWQVLSNSTLFVSCSLAATTTRAKMDAGAQQCDFGPLDTIPPYETS